MSTSTPSAQLASALRFIGRWIARAFVLLSVFLLPYLYDLSRKPLSMVWLPMHRWWMRPLGNDLIAILEYIVAPWLLAIALTAGIFTVRHSLRRTRRPLPVSSSLKGFGKASLLVTLVFLYWNWLFCTLTFALLGGQF
jgi:hypothetical protein